MPRVNWLQRIREPTDDEMAEILRSDDYRSANLATRTRARELETGRSCARARERSRKRESKRGSDPKRKLKHARRDRIYRELARQDRSGWQFVVVDAEATNLSDQVWTENEEEIEGGGLVAATYTPQQTVVLAAGNENHSETLCHAWDAALGKDARALSTEERFDFLSDLVVKFKQSFFVGYGFGYDVYQVLRGLPEKLGWEIHKQMDIKNRDFDPEERNLPAIGYKAVWLLKDDDGTPRKAFAINYLAGKWFSVGRLRNPDPDRRYKLTKYGKRAGFDYDNGSAVVIDDVASFFQCSFLDAMSGMKSSIRILPKEQELIDWGKPRRDSLADEPMNKIINYNQSELNVGSRMMAAYRDALHKLGLYPTRWYGPGAIAKELLIQKGIAPRPKRKGQPEAPHHYPNFLSASKSGKAQRWAHHAFSGGRIDLMMHGIYQGVVPLALVRRVPAGSAIYEYDLCSAYPAQIFKLISMRDGKYEERAGDTSLTLTELKALVEPMNMLSMFEIHWECRFERRHLTNEERSKIVESYHEGVGELPLQAGRARNAALDQMLNDAMGEPIPLYPLFYRINGEGGMFKDSRGRGSILYPPKGKGIYYRSELLAAIAWCERFPHAVIRFEYHGAQEFIPGCDEYPFRFVKDLFEERAGIVARTAAAIAEWKAAGCIGPEPYDILEKVIKLVLNSLYGKMAQSIGTPGKLPACTNPFFAGVVTAGCRAELQLAALRNPHGIIFFATDAILSIGPLEGLPTVMEKVLGKWEHAADVDTARGAVFFKPGNYSFYDLKGELTLKMRGCRLEFGRDFQMEEVRAGWKEGKEFLYHDSKTLVTLGQAVNTPDNWKKLGTWKEQKRKIDLYNLGTKRERGHGRERANGLVFVRPKENSEKGLSLPYYPDWLNEDHDEYLAEREGDELMENQIGREIGDSGRE